MQRRIACLVSIVVACGDVSIGDDSGLICNAEVEVPDEALLALLLDRLPEREDELPESTVWGPDLLELQGLNARDADIESIEGLQCAHGLTTLGLGGNAITDLEPLRRMAGLRELELSGNEIVDVEPLSALRGLDKLGLSDNVVTDLEPLASLTTLSHLDVSGNGVTDVGPLSEMIGLETLGLARNGLSDLAPLSGLDGLLGLELQQNEIEDVTALAGLEALRFLNLDENAIVDVAPLSGLAELETLRLARNELTSLASLSGLVSLVSLRATENAIDSLDGLADSTALRVIDLESNALVDLSVAAGLPVLERLSLQDNDVRDVDPLVGLPNLRHVDLRNNPNLTSIDALGTLPLLGYLGLGGGDATPPLAPLSGAPVLATLEVRDSGPVDLGPAATWSMLTGLIVVDAQVDDADLVGLALVPGLRSLILQNTGIADVSPFSAALLLQHFDVSGNPGVADVDFLSAMIDLQVVDVGETSVSSVAFAAEPTKLRTLIVDDTAVDDVSAVVANTFFRNGDALLAERAALSLDDCADLQALIDRDTAVETDVECP